MDTSTKKQILKLKKEIKQLKEDLAATDEEIINAVELISDCGYTDGAHHKQWCLDQVLRILLTEEEYEESVDENWDIGISP